MLGLSHGFPILSRPFELRVPPFVARGVLLQDLPASSLAEIRILHLRLVTCPPSLAPVETNASPSPARPVWCSIVAARIASPPAETDVKWPENVDDQAQV